MNNKKYFRVSTVKEALEIAEKHNGVTKFIAGGTDMMANTYQGNSGYDCLIDLNGIDELKTIKINDSYIKIGSLVTLSALKNNNLIIENFPALIEAANSVGSPLIRNKATIGGNLLCENRCIYYNQSEWWRMSIGYCLKCEGDICIVTGTDKACYSEFVSDTAPVLISLNAQIEIENNNGTRTVALEDIYSGDGIYPVTLSENDILKYIIVPSGKHERTIFRKFRQRDSLEFTWLTSAFTLFSDGSIKAVFGGVDPKPVVVKSKDITGNNDLIKTALRLARTVNNNMSARSYRREMMKYVINEAFAELSA